MKAISNIADRNLLNEIKATLEYALRMSDSPTGIYIEIPRPNARALIRKISRHLALTERDIAS